MKSYGQQQKEQNHVLLKKLCFSREHFLELEHPLPPQVVSRPANCRGKESEAPENSCDPNSFTPLHSIPPFLKYILKYFM